MKVWSIYKFSYIFMCFNKIHMLEYIKYAPILHGVPSVALPSLWQNP